MYVFANQRVAKGTIENQDDEIVSCRDDGGGNENSVDGLRRALAPSSTEDARARALS